MPPESELFTLRERQRREAREQRAEQRKLKVHEKSTYTSRLNAKNAALRKTVRLKIKMHPAVALMAVTNNVLSMCAGNVAASRVRGRGERDRER